MWLHMSNRIPCKSPKQCEARYKTVLKRKRLAIESRQQQMAPSAAKSHQIYGEDEKSLHEAEGEEEENNETEVYQVNNSKKYKTIQDFIGDCCQKGGS